MSALTRSEKQALQEERTNHQPITVTRSSIALLKLVIGQQDELIESLEEKNNRLQTALDQLKRQQTKTVRKPLKANPFKLIKGGKA